VQLLEGHLPANAYKHHKHPDISEVLLKITSRTLVLEALLMKRFAGHRTCPHGVPMRGGVAQLRKQGAVLAIRQPGESGRSQYHVLQLNGDATVVDEVIVPYVSAQQHVEDAPAMSVALTPANYRFTYVGEVGSGDNAAFVFRIAPKKKRSWLIAGQLWIDTATGAAVLQAGRLVRPPSAGIRRVELVRDTKLQDGNPSCRTTHVAMDTQRLGRGELTITEYRLGIDGSEPPPFPGSVSH